MSPATTTAAALVALYASALSLAIAARAPGQTFEVEGAALLADGRVELVLWDGECDYGTEDTAKILRRFNVPAAYPITIAHFTPYTC